MSAKQVHRRWTDEEKRIVRDYCEHGPSWDGYRELLPDRSQQQIADMRRKLGVAIGSAAKWTAKQDAVVRELYPTHGPSDAIWAEALPGKGATAIKNRAYKLGVTGVGRGHGMTGERMAEVRSHRRDYSACATPKELRWTPEQDEALVLAAKRMVDECGHSLRGCLRRLAAIVRAYRRAA